MLHTPHLPPCLVSSTPFCNLHPALSRCNARATQGKHRSYTYHECLLLLVGLEATVTKLGSGVDELDVDLLKSVPLGVGDQALQNNKKWINILNTYIPICIAYS